MQFICMDIVGPISPISLKGNRFCLMVVDMLTGYTMVVAIPSKSAEAMVKAYMITFILSSEVVHICSQITEVSSEMTCLMKSVISWGIKIVYIPVYTLQSNGKLEGFHQFIKACISKHIWGIN